MNTRYALLIRKNLPHKESVMWNFNALFLIMVMKQLKEQIQCGAIFEVIQLHNMAINIKPSVVVDEVKYPLIKKIAKSIKFYDKYEVFFFNVTKISCRQSTCNFTWILLLHVSHLDKNCQNTGRYTAHIVSWHNPKQWLMIVISLGNTIFQYQYKIYLQMKRFRLWSWVYVYMFNFINLKRICIFMYTYLYMCMYISVMCNIKLC